MVHKKVPIIIQRKEERIVSILKITRLSFFFFINLGRQTGSEISEKLEKEEALLFCSFHPGQFAILAGWQVGSLFGWSKNKHNTSHHWISGTSCGKITALILRRENLEKEERGRFCCFAVLLFFYFAVLPLVLLPCLSWLVGRLAPEQQEEPKIWIWNK